MRLITNILLIAACLLPAGAGFAANLTKGSTVKAPHHLLNVYRNASAKAVATAPSFYAMLNRQAMAAKAIVLSGKSTQAAQGCPPPTITASGPTTFCAGSSVTLTAHTDLSGVYKTSTLAGSSSGEVNATGTAAKFSRPQQLCVDAAGNVYIADFDNDLIRKITPAGLVSTYAGSTGGDVDAATATAAKFDGPNAVAIDNAGNLYVTDYLNHKIRKITTAGVVTTLAGSTQGNTDNAVGTLAKFNGPSSLTVDDSGNVYVADNNNHRIRKVRADGKTVTLAGSSSGYAEGQSAAAKFNDPFGIALDANRNVYVADQGNHRIRKITPNGLVTTFAGVGTAGTTDSPNLLLAKFNEPRDIKRDAEGNFFVADGANNTIRKITAAGEVVTIAGGTGTGTTDGVNSLFNFPTGVAIGPNGIVYVGDQTNHRIRKLSPVTAVSYRWNSTSTTQSVTFTAAATYNVVSIIEDCTSAASEDVAVTVIPLPSTPVITTLGPVAFCPGSSVQISGPSSLPLVSSPAGGLVGFADGTGEEAKFASPAGIAINSAGIIFIADEGNNRIRKVTSAGVVTTFAGSGVAGYSNATGTAAQFNAPRGLAFDAAGNLYVADAGNNRIRKITSAGVVTNYSGSGTAGFTDGTSANTKFDKPTGLAFDVSGILYVADETNNRIRKIAANGTSTTFAGSGTAAATNGTGTAAAFSAPTGLCFDATGNLFVADRGNHLIRKVTSAGLVSTYAGSVGGLEDGLLSLAKLNAPYSIAFDESGDMFISETGNHRIRKITVAGIVSTYTGDRSGMGNGYSDAYFNIPKEIAFDASGNLYVADYGNYRVRKVAPSLVDSYVWSTGETTQNITANTGGSYSLRAIAGACTSLPSTPVVLSVISQAQPVVTTSAPAAICQGSSLTLSTPAVAAETYTSTFSGSGTQGYADGAANVAKFQKIFDMAVDASGNIIFCDTYNNCIRKITPAGVISTLAGNGNSGFLNATGTAAYFDGPFQMTMDLSGNVYVASEFINYTVRKITPAGVVTTLAGSTEGDADGTGTSAKFNGISAMTTDAGGNVVLLDYNNFGAGRIRKISPAGIVSTYANVPYSIGYADDMAISPSGVIYIANQTKIYKVTSPTDFNIFVGGGPGTAANGTGTAASFFTIGGFTFDAAGNIIVPDEGNHRIRKITPAGVVTTIAGSAYGYVEGNVATAQFSYPSSVAVNASGEIIVADAGNFRFRKIQAYETSYLWSNAAITPGITATAAGSYSVQTILRGCTSVASVPVVVTVSRPSEAPAVTYTGSPELCNGQTITLTSSKAAENVWSNGETTQSITVSTSGTYMVRTISGGCTTAYSNTVEVSATNMPAPVITADGPTTFCSGGEVRLVSSESSDNIWSNFETRNFIRARTSGVYTVYTTTNGCTSATSNSITVTVIPAADAPTVTASGPISLCNGALVTLSSSVADSNLWSNGARTQSITVSDAGNYSVVTLNGTCTSATSTVNAVTASSTPLKPVTTASGALSFCTGSVTLTAPVNGITVSSYAGNGTAASTDGFGTSAAFNAPSAITTDALGNIYIAERSTYLIRKIAPNGYVSTLAGGALGYADGTGTAAQFKSMNKMACDAAGNIYIADGSRIRKITQAGIVSVYAGQALVSGNADGPAGTATFLSPYGLEMSSSGDLYLADYHNSSIRKVSAAGIVSTIAGGTFGTSDGPAANAQFSYPTDLALDAAGNIYVLEAGGKVRKVSTDGIVSTIAGDGTLGYANGTGSSAKFRSPTGLTIGTDGNIYVADEGNNRIRKVTPTGVVTTFAGLAGYASVNGDVSVAQFKSPNDIVFDLAGSFVVLESNGNAVRKIKPWSGIDGYLWSNGETTASIAAGISGSYSVQTISGGCTSLGSAIKTVSVNAPVTPVITAGGSAIICEGSTVTLTASASSGTYLWSNGATTAAVNAGASGIYTVRTIAAGCTSLASEGIIVKVSGTAAPTISSTGSISCGSGMVLTAAAGNLSVSTLAGASTSGFADGMGANALFWEPNGLAVHSSGTIYVTDNLNHRIRKITAAGEVSTFAGNGSSGFTNATGTAAQFAFPSCIAIDAAGNLYVGDGDNYSIRKITPAGVVTTLAGTGSYGYVDGAGNQAMFGGVSALTVDNAGNLYATDQGNTRIRKITPAGVVSTVAGSSSGYVDSSAPLSAKFSTLGGITIDAAGNLYVSDGGNSRLRKITPAGVVSTFAGSGNSGYLDGSGTDAKFSAPRGMTIGPDGNIYLADAGNNRIRKITPAGVVSTYAGTVYGYAEGLSTTDAKFKGPYALGFDASGSLFIADAGNNSIRKISASVVDSYLWSNNATTPAITVTSAGNYSVQSVTGGCTSSVSETYAVTGGGSEMPVITASGATTFCAGGNVTLTSSSLTNNLWSNNATTRSITVSASGSYTVRVAMSGCTSDAGSPVAVTVNPKPATPTITAGGPVNLCTGETVTLTSSSATGNLWGTGETTQSIVVGGGVTRGITLQVIGAGNCTSSTTAMVVFITNTPSTPVILTPQGTNITQGSVLLTSSVNNTANKWSNGSTGTSLVVYAPGVYSVYAYSGTCTSGVSQSVTVTMIAPPAKPVITAGGSTNICAGGSVTLTSSAQYGNHWSTGDTTHSITVSTAGSYTVYVTTAGISSATSSAVSVTVNTVPSPGIAVNGPVEFCAGGSVNLVASGSGASFLWSNGQTTASVDVTQAGLYSVRSIQGSCTSNASSAIAVSIKSAPVAAGTITGSAGINQGSSGNYSVAAISGATFYAWSYSGTGATITGIGASVSVSFAANATSGTLSVYGSNNCGFGASAMKAITVTPVSTSDITINSDRMLNGTYGTITIIGTPTITLDGDLAITDNIVVPDGATFVTGCNVVTGTGIFTLSAGATIKICNPAGIAQTGSIGAVQTSGRSFSNDASYEFNGTAAQVTGSGLPARVRNLTLNNALGLTLSNAGSVSNTLTVSSGNFNLAGKTLTLLSSKTGTARLAEMPDEAGFSNASAFTVQRWLDTAAVRNEHQGFGAYYWLGASVTGKTIDAWNTATNAYVPWTYNGQSNFGSAWLYSNTENTTPANGGWFKPATPNMPVNPGKGVRIWFNNAFFAGGATASLSETPVIGTYNLPVTYCEGTCAGNSSANGWNLVANPYPSTIDWSSGEWTKTDLANAIYVWRHKQNGYSSYVNGVGTLGGSNLIASGQGFMVRAFSAGSMLTINESVKTAATASNIREGALSLLRLKVSAADLYDEAVIVDREGSSRAYEPANDAVKYMNPNLNIWAEPTINSKQAIASMMPVAGDTIAVRLKSSSTQTVFLSATDLSDWAERFRVLIHDDKNGSILPLNSDSRLAYSLIAGQAYNLTLVLNPISTTGMSAKSAFTLNVQPNPNNGSFTLNGSDEMQSVQVFDNLGRHVYSQLLNGNTQTMHLTLPAGIYTTKVLMKKGTAISRLVIE
ncbi:MAG: SMP-30/gluconolactonase/LRE family protein [Bacteroidota bacterium]